MKLTLFTSFAVLAASVVAQSHEYYDLMARDSGENLVAREAWAADHYSPYEVALAKRALNNLQRRIPCNKKGCKKDSTCVDAGCQYCSGTRCVE